MSEKPDVPGVIVFPPLIPLVVLVAGVLLDWLLPFAALNWIPFLLRILVGLVLFVFGLALLTGANRAFKRAGTNVNPFQPSLAIVGSGIYSHLLNPMYVGGCIALFGIVLGFALEWTLVLLIVSLFVLHFGVILREERYLERKFGDDYRRYKESVPRYGWKF